MKKVFLSTLLFCAFSFAAVAQKYAYVNTGYILDNIPEYADAQAQLDDLSVQWQKEIEAKFTEIDKLYKSFQNESVLLPDDMKKKREDDIIKKEKEAKDLQKKRFGNNGDLYKKRQELVKPIQEKVYSAIEEIAAAEDDIIKKEKEAKDLQKKRFGNNGDLYKKRQELVKPIQEKVYSAIEEIAAAENYALIFDKTGTTTLIYTNPKYDISEQVLDKLGYTYKPQEGENKKK